MALLSKLNDPKKAKKFFESKLMFTTGPVELMDRMKRGEKINIIDVRDAEDYAEGHVPCSINVPAEQWRTAKGLSKKMLNIIYCYSQTCHLAARAALFFSSRGYSVMELEGGFEGWKEHQFEIEGAKPTEQTRAA